MKARFFAVAIVMLAFALPARAATLRIDTVDLGGGWLRADAVLDPNGDDLNAVSGTLTFDAGLLDLKRVEDRSTVPLWLTRPSLARTGEVDFSALAPGGFGSRAATLFSALFQEVGVGDARLRFRDVLALKDDGAATPAALTLLPADVSVDGSRPGDAAPPPADTRPPEPFTPRLARDPSTFDGAWFLAFAAQDKDSGVAGYDVAEEGAFTDPSRIESGRWRAAESPYRLEDQSLRSWIYVRATDRAGNARIETLPPTVNMGYQAALGWSILAVLGLCAVAALWLIRRARRA